MTIEIFHASGSNRPALVAGEIELPRLASIPDTGGMEGVDTPAGRMVVLAATQDFGQEELPIEVRLPGDESFGTLYLLKGQTKLIELTVPEETPFGLSPSEPIDSVGFRRI